MNMQDMGQIQLPVKLKEELEALASDNNMTVGQVIEELLATNKPKDHLANSIVSKKKSTNIPSVIRQQFDIQPGNTLFWDIVDNEIVLKVDKSKED